MALVVSTEFDWQRLKPLCDAVWNGKITHNREQAFYEYLRQQPTLVSGEEPVVQVVAEDGAVEGLLGFLKFSGHGNVYSALNWYTKPRGEAGMHGALLLQYWQRAADVMVAGHPRSQLAIAFKRARWQQLTTQTFWWPASVAGLYATWPGRNKWRLSVRLAAGLLRTHTHRRPAPKYQAAPLQFTSELDAWLVDLRRTYDFFDRPAKYLAWQYGTWQPVGQQFASYGVHAPTGEMVGFFVLRTGQLRSVVCELMARPGYWGDVISCLVSVATDELKAPVIRLRTCVGEAVAACHDMGWVSGESSENFVKYRPHVKPLELKRTIFSTGDTDEYLL